MNEQMNHEVDISRRGLVSAVGLGLVAAALPAVDAPEADAATYYSLAYSTKVTSTVASNIKKVWDLIETTVLKWSPTESDGLTWSISISSYKIPTKNKSELLSGFTYTKVNLPYVTVSAVTSSSSSYIQKVKVKLGCSLSSAKKAATKIDSAITTAKGHISSSMSTTEKIMAIHDYLAGTIAYNKYASSSASAYDTPYTIYGALVQRKAVCEGYARAFLYLCSLYSISCLQATTSSHRWNVVKVGSSWYHVDVTSDTGSSATAGMGRVSHDCLLVSRSALASASSISRSSYTVHNYLSTVSYSEASSSKSGFWTKSDAAMTYYSGYWYYLDSSTKLVKHKLGASAYTTVKSNGTVKWYKYGSSSSYYSGSYAGGLRLGNYFYYTLPAKLMRYNLKTGSTSTIKTVSSSYRVYGLQAATDGSYINLYLKKTPTGSTLKTVKVTL